MAFFVTRVDVIVPVEFSVDAFTSEVLGCVRYFQEIAMEVELALNRGPFTGHPQNSSLGGIPSNGLFPTRRMSRVPGASDVAVENTVICEKPACVPGDTLSGKSPLVNRMNNSGRTTLPLGIPKLIGTELKAVPSRILLLAVMMEVTDRSVHIPHNAVVSSFQA